MSDPDRLAGVVWKPFLSLKFCVQPYNVTALPSRCSQKPVALLHSSQVRTVTPPSTRFPITSKGMGTGMVVYLQRSPLASDSRKMPRADVGPERPLFRARSHLYAPTQGFVWNPMSGKYIGLRHPFGRKFSNSLFWGWMWMYLIKWILFILFSFLFLSDKIKSSGSIPFNSITPLFIFYLKRTNKTLPYHMRWWVYKKLSYNTNIKFSTLLYP
jgi:hypothetical protein